MEILRYLGQLKNIRVIFAISFAFVQLLDGISTVLAVKRGFHEVNPILQSIMAVSDNLALDVFIYHTLTFIIVLGTILFVDMCNEIYWKKRRVRIILLEAYFIGIVFLGLLRLLFVVIPNFLLLIW